MATSSPVSLAIHAAPPHPPTTTCHCFKVRSRGVGPAGPDQNSPETCQGDAPSGSLSSTSSVRPPAQPSEPHQATTDTSPPASQRPSRSPHNRGRSYNPDDLAQALTWCHEPGVEQLPRADSPALGQGGERPPRVVPTQPHGATDVDDHGASTAGTHAADLPPGSDDHARPQRELTPNGHQPTDEVDLRARSSGAPASDTTRNPAGMSPTVTRPSRADPSDSA